MTKLMIGERSQASSRIPPCVITAYVTSLGLQNMTLMDMKLKRFSTLPIQRNLMGKFRKKPVVIEAVQFTGHNDEEIEAFVGSKGLDSSNNRPTWIISTFEGDMTAEVGDWIIKGVQGAFYPCKPDIFDATYEAVEDEAPKSDDSKSDYDVASYLWGD